MTIVPSEDSFLMDEPALTRFHRTAERRADRTLYERCGGFAVCAAAHAGVFAILVFGLHVARPLIEDKPIEVNIRQVEQKPPEPMPVTAPKIAMPAILSVPVPQIEIAAPPPPAAITAVPPAPNAPVTRPAPPVSRPVAAPGEGRENYFARLTAHLNRHKRYPPEARAARLQGVVMVRFVMDRSGFISSREIVKSSGRAALDREALALMERAQPLPAMPSDMAGNTLDAIVPINFSLRDFR